MVNRRIQSPERVTGVGGRFARTREFAPYGAERYANRNVTVRPMAVFG